MGGIITNEHDYISREDKKWNNYPLAHPLTVDWAPPSTPRPRKRRRAVTRPPLTAPESTDGGDRLLPHQVELEEPTEPASGLPEAEEMKGGIPD